MAGAPLRLTIGMLGSTGLLCLVALVNGYPLVFPDTGTYITQALELAGDSTRPPYYSLFLASTHWGLSLWPVVVVQSALAAAILYLTVRTVFGPGFSGIYVLKITALLTALSSMPWHIGQLIPDAFTGMLVLATFIATFGWRGLTKAQRVFIALLLIASTTFHYSHLPLLMLTGVSAIVLVAAFQRSWRGLLAPTMLVACSLVTAAAAFFAYSAALTGRMSMSPDGNAFLLARMIVDGTAVDYLQEVCPTTKYVLCDHLDEIDSSDPNAFMWSPRSPWRHMEKTLGFLGARDEAGTIVRATMRRFTRRQAVKSFGNFVAQLGAFRTGDTLCPCIGDMKVNQVIARHFPAEHKQYLTAMQGQNRLPLEGVRLVHESVAAIAAVGCLGFLVSQFATRRQLAQSSRGLAILILVIVASLLANAAITGVLSGAFDRYQSRVIWLLVLGFLLAAAPPRMTTEVVTIV